ncbi:hypothetical protein IX336_001659 [Porphyromonas levii]|nr:hypothetical protein [Porphyromonas levii]
MDCHESTMIIDYSILTNFYNIIYGYDNNT